MFERGNMNKQDRGHDTHPKLGYLPDDNASLIGVYLGHFLGFAGYLGIGVMAVSSTITSFSWVYPLLVMVAEFMVCMAAIWRRGQLRMNSAQP